MTSVPFRIQGNSVIIQGVENGIGTSLILDTGDAVGPVFTAADARRLGLAEGQAEGVEGAGGASSIYQTTATVTFGDRTYASEQCAVDPALEGQSLLGLPFFTAKCAGLLFDFSGSVLVLIGS
jgi:hypothetical protein